MSDPISPTDASQLEIGQSEDGQSEKHTTKTSTPAKPTLKVGGLSPAAQKLQNLRDKAAQVKSGAKPVSAASAASFKAKSLAGTRKTSFQRKAV